MVKPVVSKKSDKPRAERRTLHSFNVEAVPGKKKNSWWNGVIPKRTDNAATT